MSDLISRSELLKRFLVNKDGHRIPERDCDNFEVNISIKDVKAIIKEHPTAYDIGKVVEKLEKQRDIIFQDTDSEIKTVRTNAWDKIDVLNKAIEIVKHGGASDDVCESKQGKWIFDKFTAKYGNPYRCSCCSEEFGDTYNYCPNCGVGMKEVEYMEINDLHMIEANGWNAGFEYGFRKGYNNAIDEAICKVEEHKTKGCVTGITNNPFEFGACQMADDIVKILEQLKVGGENDNLRR